MMFALFVVAIVTIGVCYSQEVSDETRYIVHFHDSSEVAGALHQFVGSKTKSVVKVLNGSSKSVVVQGYTLKELEELPNVKRVSKDKLVGFVQQEEVPEQWGLDRIDQLDLPLDNEEFVPVNNGEGVDIYVIDTGCDFGHQEFSQMDDCTRSFETIYVPDSYEGDMTNTDGNGHGTHCAGTAAGNWVGVARCANVLCGRVLGNDGYGYTSDILAAMDIALERHINNPDAKSVVSMSLGGSRDYPVDDMMEKVDEMVAAGMIVSVAAGNSGRNANGFSPAAAESAWTIGASDVNDEIAYFSNYGEVVDIYAPGVDINSACARSACEVDNQYVSYSGTSMACPHVSGVAALLLSKAQIPMRSANDVEKITESLLCERSQEKINGVPEGVSDLVQVPFSSSGCITWETVAPTEMPTGPSEMPTEMPSFEPTDEPTTAEPSELPTGPSEIPTVQPTIKSFPYWEASNTNSGNINTVDENIRVCSGAEIEFSVCTEFGGECNGDTYLRLTDESGFEVASNDDSCGYCSNLLYFFTDHCQMYTLKQGCYGNNACGGRTSIIMHQEGTIDAPPTSLPTQYPVNDPTSLPTREGIICDSFGEFTVGRTYKKGVTVVYKNNAYVSTVKSDTPDKWVFQGICRSRPACTGIESWVRLNRYNKGSSCTYNNALYKAIKRNRKKRPDRNPSQWEFVETCA